MKKRVLVACVFLILIGLSGLVSADIIQEKINSIVHYAELYEVGTINYLQLVVYGSTIREEINRELGQEYVVEGDWVHRGLSQEDVKRLFGQPTEMTNWVWVINKEREEHIDVKLPRWEKRLFDGRKISITFNAWPQVIKKGNEIIQFYEIDFHIRFKTHYTFNIDDMLRDIKYKAEQYLENKQGGEALVEKAVEYREFLQGYIEQNNYDCKNVMSEFFDSEHKQEQEKKARFTVFPYEGKNLLLRINVEACESCDWPHVNMWFDIDVFGPGFKHEDIKESPQKDIKSMKELSIDKLNDELEATIRKLVSLVKASDEAGKFTNPERIGYYRTMLQKINQVLDEKYYENKRFREENYEKRLAILNDILGEYGEIEKEALTQIRYENRLVEKVEVISYKHCRHVGELPCDLDEGCKDGECIDAKGGLEDCQNGIDDDGDGIIDCPDPDCAVDCGWICKDICQEECWPCNERECSSECKECRACDFKTEGKKCENICEDTCWKCEREKCQSQPFCETCTRCQKEAWHELEAEKCNRICDDDEDSRECENCQANVKYEGCRDVCGETCWKCRSEYCHQTDICQKCWDCQEKGNKDCGNFCDDCWECQNVNCDEKEICSECKVCEKRVSREIEEERCEKRCNRCDDCIGKKGEKACKEEKDCKECDRCREEEKRHLCDNVCEDECWPCHDEKCGDMCKTCWGCDFEKDGKKCENLCEDCWDCTWDRCGSQEFCKSCKECEKRIYEEEHPCALPCDMCGGCTKKGDGKEDYCVESCNKCFDCETPDNIKNCIKVCNRLVDEKDEKQRESCHNMCKEEVVFYCNGAPQDTPCLQTYYMCPHAQRTPCNFFICTYSDGTVVKQTAICGQEHICGEHRKWIDKQCICDEGWYNCDEDPINGCESRKVCEGVKEFCNDLLDNDFDGLIDCQDLSDCENERCDLDSLNVCKDGECIINCPENFILNEDEECVPIEICMVGYEYDENGICVRIEPEMVCCKTWPVVPEPVYSYDWKPKNECPPLREGMPPDGQGFAIVENIFCKGKEPDINVTTNVTINVTTNVTINVTTNVTINVTTNVTINVTENVTNVTECAKEGEGFDKMNPDALPCCPGLTPRGLAWPSEPIGRHDGCYATLTWEIICTNCGDGICGLGENWCICLEDCPKPEEVPCITDIDCGVNSTHQGRERCVEIRHFCENGECSSTQTEFPGFMAQKEGCRDTCGNGICDLNEERHCPNDCPEPVKNDTNVTGLGCLQCGDGCLPMGERRVAYCEEPTKEFECIEEDGKCVVLEPEPECVDGNETKLECPTGEEIVTEICSNGAWITTGAECPVIGDLGCSKCGNGCVTGEQIMVMDCLEPTEEFECVEVEGECVVEPIEPPVCADGDETKVECPTGEEIVTEVCSQSAWIATDAKCPVEEDLGCSKCGNMCLPLKGLMAVMCLETTEEFECIEVGGKCVVSEREPEEKCLEEGEVGGRECCPGLEEMSVGGGDGRICNKAAGHVCTAYCGDGICEGRENPCNCEDCPIEEEEEVEEEEEEVEEEEEEEIECPDGYYFKDDVCLFIEDEGEVCGQWQILNDNGVCEDIIEEEEEVEEEEEEIELIETGKRCEVREDCEDENAICSMGVCKLIPEEVIEEEDIILNETVEVDEVPEEEIEEEEVEEEEIEEEEVEEEEAEEVIEEEEEAVVEEEEEEEEAVEEGEAVAEPEAETEEEAVVEEEEEAVEEEEETEEAGEEEDLIPTGNLIMDMLTGAVIKERDCEENEDCGINALCDPYQGNCHCEEYFFDCNGRGDGSDADGCESEDPTCGGKWDACKHECMPNQVCIEELGRCECKKGFRDCDGDWENGCETKKEKCEECSTDDDCAPSRCTGHDNSVVKFACVEENPYREDKAVIAFSGGCNIRATGKTESWLNFDFWGEEVEELNELRYRFERGPSGWCRREIEGLKKQRKELESALNPEFLKWFFEEYAAGSPGEWENHISGIFASYWRFVDNARQLHKMSFCLEDPEIDIDLIDIEYESEYGEMHYWEEIKKLEGAEIITPYMQIWVFPSKEFIKEEFKTAMREGRMPGPEGEKEGPEGPSPKEIEEAKNNPEIMKKINKLSDKYGGSADFLIEVKDEDETLYRVLMSINPEDIVKLEIINEDNPYNEEPDVNVVIDFDFLYNTIKSFEEEAHLESPPWARKPRRPIKKIASAGKVIARIAAAVLGGNIKVSPITAIPSVLSTLKLMAGGSMK